MNIQLTGTVMFKIKILNPKNCHMFITNIYESTQTNVNLIIPPSTSWQEVTLSSVIDETVKGLWLHVSFYGDVDDICYTDDWRLTIQ